MREVCNAEWDDIQDQLKEKGAEIERLKALLVRAADALENVNRCIIKQMADADKNYDPRFYSALRQETHAICNEVKKKIPTGLIAELRKAPE